MVAKIIIFKITISNINIKNYRIKNTIILQASKISNENNHVITMLLNDFLGEPTGFLTTKKNFST